MYLCCSKYELVLSCSNSFNDIGLSAEISTCALCFGTITAEIFNQRQTSWNQTKVSVLEKLRDYIHVSDNKLIRCRMTKKKPNISQWQFNKHSYVKIWEYCQSYFQFICSYFYLLDFMSWMF